MTRPAGPQLGRLNRPHRCDYHLKDGRVQPWTCDHCGTELTSRHPHELHLAVNAHINAESRQP